MGDSWDPFPLIYQLLGVKSILLSVNFTISYLVPPPNTPKLRILNIAFA